MVPGSRVIVGREARDLGLNIIVYALATFDLGQFYAHGGLKEVSFFPSALEGTSLTSFSSGDFVFLQLLHGPRSDPDPTSFGGLFRTLTANTAIKVKPRRRLVKLEDPALFDYPFLYMTGHGSFSFSETERKILRSYLKNGGFLFADACCGNLSFDRSFRREMKEIFPEKELKILKPDHPIFKCFYDVSAAKLTPRAEAAYPEVTFPPLEALEIEGSCRLIYSKLDIGNCFEGVDHPFSRGYEASFGRKLATNVIVYSMTH